MSAIQSVVLVVGALTVAGVAWRLVRKRQDQILASLPAGLVVAGEPVVLGPERAAYRGALKRFTVVKSSGVLALTERRLIFRPILGSPIEIPVEEIRQIAGNKWFLKSYRSGHLHLIIQTADGNQVGFIVADFDRWKVTLEARMTRVEA